MVEFKKIVSQTTKAEYEKADLVGYIVSGTATYNMGKKLIDGNGNVRNVDNEIVGSFRIYKQGENMRISVESDATMMDAINDVAKATLADLGADYPEL